MERQLPSGSSVTLTDKLSRIHAGLSTHGMFYLQKG